MCVAMLLPDLLEALYHLWSELTQLGHAHELHGSHNLRLHDCHQQCQAATHF